MAEAGRIALFRYRSSLHRQLANSLGVVIVVALIGGVALAALAAARRTQSSYPAFMRSTNPSDLTISYFDGAAPPELSAAVAKLPHVTRVASMIAVAGLPLATDGAPRRELIPDIDVFASTGGLMADVDRPTIVAGRMADPGAVDEVVMTAAAASLLGAHLGRSIPFGFYTPDQVNSPGFGSAEVPPAMRINATLVGIMVVNNQVVQDDVDRLPATVLFTPTLADAAVGDALNTLFGLQLSGGGRDVAAAEQAFIDDLPGPANYDFHVTSRIEAQVQRTVKPETVALGVFGLISAIVALLVALQAVSRRLQSGSEDRLILRALGATRLTVVGDGLLGVLISIVVGAVLAVLTAVVLSPLAPFGPVRQVYPSPGVSVDWTVLAGGLVVLIVGLSAGALLMAFWNRPGRAATERRDGRVSLLGRMASSPGLPPSGVVGLRFAVDPGRRRGGPPARSTLVSFALATLLVVATITFASGLRTLVSRPDLFGWNWSYALFPTDRVPPQTGALLDADPDVASWSAVSVATVEVDGQNVPTLVGTPNADPSPRVVTGHGLAADDEIVLGTTTLAQLHKRVGDIVVVSYGTPRQAPFYVPPTKVVIAGTATLPAVGWPSLNAEHTSMGTGAYLSEGLEPAAMKEAQVNPDPVLNGPDLVFVRFRTTVSRAEGANDIQRIVAAANAVLAKDAQGGQADSIRALGVQRPAEIVNYRSIGATPTILAGVLALGALIGLALALIASVRYHRRDLAMLKVVGFTNGQLSAAVAWQASVAAIGGIVLGVPLGIVLGRQLWIRFAHSIAATAEPTVPVLAAVAVGVGALAFANVVAALPGRSAARTRTGILLRAE